MIGLKATMKKRKKNASAPSIMQSEKCCYITGETRSLHKHHIYHGTGQRELSERNGCYCWLKPELHNMSDQGVHFEHEFDLRLKRECQRRFEQTHSRREFMQIFGRSYL